MQVLTTKMREPRIITEVLRKRENPTGMQVTDLRPLQLEAVQQRFTQLKNRIPGLKQVAKKFNVERIDKLEDLIPLMFAHSTYKTYPKSYLDKGNWQGMNRWMQGLVSSDRRVMDVDVSQVKDLDGWLDAHDTHQSANGYWFTHSSGTTGQPGIFPWSSYTMDVLMTTLHKMAVWRAPYLKTEKIPIFFATFEQGHSIFTHVPRRYGELHAPSREHLHYCFPGIMRASMIRKATIIRQKMAQGTLSPTEQKAIAEQQQAFRKRAGEQIMAYIKVMESYKGQKVFLFNGVSSHYDIAKLGLKMGMSGLFDPNSFVIFGGGWKGRPEPADFWKVVIEFTGIPKRQWGNFLGMTEWRQLAVGSSENPNELHIAQNAIPLFFNREVTEIIDGRTTDKARGVRLGFFDPAAEHYWGALVTGDRCDVRFEENATIIEKLDRFTDDKDIDEDKLSCSSTIDSYVGA